MHSSHCRKNNTDGWTLNQGLAAQYAAQAGLDPDLAAEAGEEVWDVLKSLRDATREADPQRQAKLVRRTKARLAKVLLSKAGLSRHGELVQHIEAKLLALQGRGGDTELAHLTLGEMVVPPQLQTPEVVHALLQAAQNAGVDLRRYTAGSPASSVNPKTGLEEYSLYDLEQFDGGRNTPPQWAIEEVIARGSYTPFISYIPDYNIDNSPGSQNPGGGSGGGGGTETPDPDGSSPEGPNEPFEHPDVPRLPGENDIDYFDRLIERGIFRFEDIGPLGPGCSAGAICA